MKINACTGRVLLAHQKPKDLVCGNEIKLKASKKIVKFNKNGISS
jgi:hypothetical protein